jgi:phosphate transport system permease protein
MTELVETGVRTMSAERPKSRYQGDEFVAHLRRRYAAERRFKIAGYGSIGIAAAMLVVLLSTIISQGYTAFWQTRIQLEVTVDPAEVAPVGTTDRQTISKGNFSKLVRESLLSQFPDITERADRRKVYEVLSTGAAYELGDRVMDDPSLIGGKVTLWVTADDNVDQLMKGLIDRKQDEGNRRINNLQLRVIDKLVADKAIALKFNTTLFTKGDSREPELAGLWGSIKGSFLTLLVTMCLAMPIGVSAAIYLEEFAPKNRFTDFIEVNINNLAAVPSIVYGLLGLAVFLNFFGMPRSAPVVGGVVLALMTLPIIIIAPRAALKAVPPSIRDAALGIGASPLQAVLHHRLPLAMPGILTGTILGMAHALGETAPLLMIGMVAFVVDIPGGFTDSATLLPVQIYMWADSPERAFSERTSAAIMVLLGFLVMMNAAAVLLRKKFERRW